VNPLTHLLEYSSERSHYRFLRILVIFRIICMIYAKLVSVQLACMRDRPITSLNVGTHRSNTTQTFISDRFTGVAADEYITL